MLVVGVLMLAVRAQEKPEGKSAAKSGSQATKPAATSGTQTPQAGSTPAADNAQPPAAAEGGSLSNAPPDSKEVELLKGSKPVYPIEAQRNGIQGEVLLKVFISERGNVDNVEVERGDPVLVPAAVDAAKKWKFKPATLNGNLIRSVVPVAVSFAQPLAWHP